MDEVRKSIIADENVLSDKADESQRRTNAYSSTNKTDKTDDGASITKTDLDNKSEVKDNNAVDPGNAELKKAPAAIAASQVSSPAKKTVTPQSPTRSAMMEKELEKEQRSKKVLSRFYFTASIASDGNAISGTAIKNVTAMYGAGIGYNINKRFSIQTGIYAGKKLYTADSTDYYLKPGYWRMVKIRNIDADCYVVSVPISLRFNVTTGRSGKFYATTGLSTYLMKKETYDYYYYHNNDTLRHAKEVYGENRHFMSVLDLSLGYERKWSKHFSLMGEPYLKLPLQGIGEGKVDLYSFGFMLGLKWTP